MSLKLMRAKVCTKGLEHSKQALSRGGDVEGNEAEKNEQEMGRMTHLYLNV